MNTVFQKTIFFYTLVALLLTCPMYSQTEYKLFAEKSLGNYKLLHFVKGQDSLVIIKKNVISNKKIENKIDEIVAGKIGKRISKVKVNGKIYWFYFKMKTQNGLLINAGGFQPGKGKETIYTYRSFPILVEN